MAAPEFGALKLPGTRLTMRPTVDPALRTIIHNPIARTYTYRTYGYADVRYVHLGLVAPGGRFLCVPDYFWCQNENTRIEKLKIR